MAYKNGSPNNDRAALSGKLLQHRLSLELYKKHNCCHYYTTISLASNNNKEGQQESLSITWAFQISQDCPSLIDPNLNQTLLEEDTVVVAFQVLGRQNEGRMRAGPKFLPCI